MGKKIDPDEKFVVQVHPELFEEMKALMAEIPRAARAGVEVLDQGCVQNSMVVTIADAMEIEPAFRLMVEATDEWIGDWQCRYEETKDKIVEHYRDCLIRTRAGELDTRDLEGGPR